MSGANFNDTDKQAEQFDAVQVIRKESDFPDPILAPDGGMRIPLEITTSYVYDPGELEISTPFLVPERLLGLERVRHQSYTNTTFIYTGTAPLFYGRNASALEVDKVDFVAQTPGTKCFDMVAGFQIFEHAMSPLIFLLEQGRVLHSGGSILLEWPPANDLYSGGDNPHHQVCYTPGQAKALMEKASFSNIKLFYDDMTVIPEEEYWKGEQQKMLCVSGTKLKARDMYVRRAWA